jgi:hypothetical protein
MWPTLYQLRDDSTPTPHYTASMHIDTAKATIIIKSDNAA